jgi:hypothetical protein
LASCASNPPLLQTQFVTPPATLLQPTPKPVFAGRTNLDLATYALDLKDALQSCNDDKAALRNWINKVSNGRPAH